MQGLPEIGFSYSNLITAICQPVDGLPIGHHELYAIQWECNSKRNYDEMGNTIRAQHAFLRWSSAHFANASVDQINSISIRADDGSTIQLRAEISRVPFRVNMDQYYNKRPSVGNIRMGRFVWWGHDSIDERYF